MSASPTQSASLRSLFNTTASRFSPAMLGRAASNDACKNNGAKKALSKKRAIAKKVINYTPIAQYKQHTLHYALKTTGYLPTPLLEGLVNYLKGPTSKQYLHANAHLRLIIAVNAKLKTALQLAELVGLRKRFAADAVAMQAPKVWRQARPNLFNTIKPIIKHSVAPVSWQDKMIANADGGNMVVRCYHSGNNTGNDASNDAGIGTDAFTENNYNRDQVAMLFLHGGGFCIGDVDTHHEFCHALCAQTGWSVVSVDYRLAPEHPVPTALRDSIAAYAWLAEHCTAMGALPSRIVLAGDSAGGCLASLLAQQVATPTQSSWLDLGVEGQKIFDQLQNLPPPLAQMPLYPVTDVETDYPSWALYGKGLLLDHADIAVFDAACLQSSKLNREHPLLSPMTGDNRQVCPTFMVAAELDVLRDQALAYAEQLTRHGVAVETHTVMGAPHGFIHFMSVHQGLRQETRQIIEQFAQFVYQVLSLQKQPDNQKVLVA